MAWLTEASRHLGENLSSLSSGQSTSTHYRPSGPVCACDTPFRSHPLRHSGPSATVTELSITTHSGRQVHPTVGSNPTCKCANDHVREGPRFTLDRSIWCTGRAHLRQGVTVHFGIVGDSVSAKRHASSQDNGVPSAVEWDCGTISSSSEICADGSPPHRP